MKILQICHRVPYPAIDGGNIAMMNMAMALTEAGHELHQFSLNTKKHFIDTSSIPEELRKRLHIQSSTIDTEIKILDLLLNLFTNESYNISRFYNKKVEEELIRVLRENSFDIIQLETLFTTPYINCIKNNSTAKIVFRAHNIEHIIWKRLATKEKDLIRKFYLTLLASRLKKYEIQILNKIDALIPITSVDETMFREFNFKGPVITVPVSIDINDYKILENEKKEMCLFHLGSMDWMPNLEAVEWFLKFCWPALNELFPDLKLFLAGRSFPKNIVAANYPNVICEGRIEDSHSYISKKQFQIRKKFI